MQAPVCAVAHTKQHNPIRLIVSSTMATQSITGLLDDAVPPTDRNCLAADSKQDTFWFGLSSRKSIVGK